MTVYAESSAVLAWLLGEPAGARVVSVLDGADRIYVSALTLTECRRALRRGVAGGALSVREAERARDALALAADGWRSYALSDEQWRRAGDGFPVEPVRTLDALHLAAAEDLRRAGDVVAILSLDRRVRANAAALGLDIEPPDGG